MEMGVDYLLSFSIFIAELTLMTSQVSASFLSSLLDQQPFFWMAV